MASTPYMDQYLENLKNLPLELERNFTLMRDLDSRTQEKMCNIDKMADDYLSNIKTYSGDTKKEKMTDIQLQFNKAKEYSDDKVQLSIQTYELVDTHIRKLDVELARFEAEIQNRASRTSKNVNESLQKGGNYTISEEKTVTHKTSTKKQTLRRVAKTSGTSSGGLPQVKIETPSVSAVANPINPTNSVASVVVKTDSVTDVGAGVIQPQVFDMPIDPNEPTYCLCKEVSYGQMIGCDNPDCPIEWFHFPCVKLNTKPKGKWFCPTCMADVKKK
ncbi:inhibitor of growth protein 5-like isoform X1 [Aphis gossypii]|nr:inhibitor of growth protein 5-like isoform X1 [Aphis gossypii]